MSDCGCTTCACAQESSSIPPPGTEKCDAALNIRGEHFPCELQPPHTGWGHQNKKAEALWQ